MQASYSLKDDQEVLTADVADGAGVRKLLDLVAQHPADGVLPTVLLTREDGDTLSLSPRESGEVYLVWVDSHDESWSTVGGKGSSEEDVPFMYFGTYSEAGGDQFVARDAALKAAEAFMQGGARADLGLRFEQD